jgi:flagellin-like protein
MRKIIKNNKALSSVLSTILMILIVVIGMSLVFAFFVNYVRDYQLGRGSSVLELAEIEDVWFHPNMVNGSFPVDVWLYNYGKIDIQISSVYVDGIPVNFTYQPTTVQVGQHAKMIVLLNWTSGEDYDIKIITARSSVFEGEYVAPNIA